VSVRFLLAVCGVAFLGGLLSLAGCSHQTFETCLSNKLLAQVDARVQAAKACDKNTECLIQDGVSDVLELKNDVDECNAATTDGGADR